MRYIADHDFHIHSTVSLCCHDENQTPETILEYAKENTDKFYTVNYYSYKFKASDYNVSYKEATDAANKFVSSVTNFFTITVSLPKLSFTLYLTESAPTPTITLSVTSPS